VESSFNRWSSSGRALPSGLALLGVLFLGGCWGAKSTGDAASGGNLPKKSPIYPSGGIFSTGDLAAPVAPNDPLGSSQEAVFNALRATYAWGNNTDCTRDGFKIAVVDTGSDFNHEDLDANLNDGLGFNKNFVSGVAGQSAANDDHDYDGKYGHGSHVAGIIGAVGNNNKGVTGVCWSADIVTAKALDKKGSATTSDVIAAMDWALNRTGVKVLNASFGISLEATSASENDYYEDLFSDVMATAESKGIIVVAAAGNSGNDVDVDRVYPAALSSSNIVAVAANVEGNDGQEGIFISSNYGGHTIHLSAPGFEILSTLPDNQYGLKTGTSMASPMVAGSIALAWTHIGTNNISASQMMSLLFNNVEKHLGTKSRKPGYYLLTGGKLDLGALLEAANIFKDSLN